MIRDTLVDLPHWRSEDKSIEFAKVNRPSIASQGKRRERMSHEGLPESQFDRLDISIGMDIYTRTPKEIAFVIMAKVVIAQRARKPDLAAKDAITVCGS